MRNRKLASMIGLSAMMALCACGGQTAQEDNYIQPQEEKSVVLEQAKEIELEPLVEVPLEIKYEEEPEDEAEEETKPVPVSVSMEIIDMEEGEHAQDIKVQYTKGSLVTISDVNGKRVFSTDSDGNLYKDEAVVETPDESTKDDNLVSLTGGRYLVTVNEGKVTISEGEIGSITVDAKENTTITNYATNKFAVSTDIPRTLNVSMANNYSNEDSADTEKHHHSEMSGEFEFNENPMIFRMDNSILSYSSDIDQNTVIGLTDGSKLEIKDTRKATSIDCKEKQRKGSLQQE